MPSTPSRHHGFTLAELLVAVAVSIVVITAVMMVFTSTSEAIRHGGANNEVINVTRTIMTEVQRDFDQAHLLGPTDGAHGAFMAIVSREVNKVRLSPLEPARTIRSDQLLFFRERGDYEPTAPGYPNSYDARAYQANYVRIWYGHPYLTDPNGGGGSNQLSAQRSSAADWILGRQVLFLLNENGAAENSQYRMKASLTNPAASMTGTAQGGGQPDPVLGSDKYLWHGYVQVALQPLFDTASYGSGRGIIGNTTLYNINHTLSNAVYRTQVYRYGYFNDATMLRVNPRPQHPTDNAETYQTWLIAQNHANWAEQVSEFKVEMALDTTNDGKVDVDEDGNIIWYDGLDTVPGQVTGIDGSWWVNSTQKYTPWHAGATHTGVSLYRGDNATPTPRVFIFRHDDDQAYTSTSPASNNNSKWPYMLRLTFRIHDQNLQTRDRDGSLGRFVEMIVPIRRP